MEIAWCLICHLWYLVWFNYLLIYSPLISWFTTTSTLDYVMIVTRQYTYGWTTSPKPAAVAVTVTRSGLMMMRERKRQLMKSKSHNRATSFECRWPMCIVLVQWFSLTGGLVEFSCWVAEKNLQSLIRQRASQHISWPSANFFCVELKCIGQLFFRWPLNDQIVSGRNRILFLIRRSQVYQSEVYLWLGEFCEEIRDFLDQMVAFERKKSEDEEWKIKVAIN